MSAAIPAEIVGDTDTIRERLSALDRDLVIQAVSHGDLVRDDIRSVIPRREQMFVEMSDRWHGFHEELHRRHLGHRMAQEPAAR